MDAINDQSPFKTELERQKWMLENMTKDRNAFEKKADKYAEQIRELGDYILDNDLMPKGFEGGAIKCAIQIIKQAHAELTRLKNAGMALDKDRGRILEENKRYRQALEEIISGEGLSKFLDENDWAIESDFYVGIARKAIKD